MPNNTPLVPGIFHGYIRWKGEFARTVNYTLTKEDSGNLFTNSGAGGAVTFTLPKLAPNLVFGFKVVADFNVIVAAHATDVDKIEAFNDAAADSVAFSTAGQLIGGGVILESNLAGTKWRVSNYSAGTNVITVAT